MEEDKQRDLDNAREFLNSLNGHFGLSSIAGERFIVSYVPEEILMVTMVRDGPLLERLVTAFSEAVGYNPFCKYTDLGGMKTYEWDKTDPDGRFSELEEKRDLVRFSN